MDSNSRALPMHFYRDPAEVVEIDQLDRLGCKACEHAKSIFDKLLCTEPRNEKQVGMPWKGHRCRWFKLKGNA